MLHYGNPVDMSLPFTSLSSATSPVAGAVKDLETVSREHTMYVRVTGAPSDLQVDLEGSHDSVTWFSLGTVNEGVISGGQARVNTPFDQTRYDLVRYVRANLITLSGGSSPAVTATIASSE